MQSWPSMYCCIYALAYILKCVWIEEVSKEFLLSSFYCIIPIVLCGLILGVSCLMSKLVLSSLWSSCDCLSHGVMWLLFRLWLVVGVLLDQVVSIYGLSVVIWWAYHLWKSLVLSLVPCMRSLLQLVLAWGTNAFKGYTTVTMKIYIFSSAIRENISATYPVP